MRNLLMFCLVSWILAGAGCVATTPGIGIGGPDLEVLAGDLLIYPTPLVVGQPVVLEAKVRNSGTAPASEFRIGFFADGHLIGEPLTAVNLDPADFILAQGSWTPDAAGQKRLEVRADILDQVAERREYNNIRLIYLTAQAGSTATVSAETALITVPGPPPATGTGAPLVIPGRPPVAAETATVPPPPVPPPPGPRPPQVEYVINRDTIPAAPAGRPDLAIALPDLSYSQAPQVGKEMTFSLQVHNTGNANLNRPATLLILINGSPIPSRAQVNYIAPGNMVMVHLPWVPTTDGWSEITVVIDPDDEVAESSKNNNLVKRSLYVRP